MKANDMSAGMKGLEELRDRLREQYGDPDTGGFEYVNPDGPEAADRIATLEAEVVRLRGLLGSIEGASDPDCPDSYRADDHEGALDYIHAKSRAALAAGEG